MGRIGSKFGLWLFLGTTFAILLAMPGVGLAEDAAPASGPAQSLADFPLHRLYIVGALILLMALLFVLLLWWQKSIEQAGYFAHIYQDTVENMEADRLSAPYQDMWARGAYFDEIYLRQTQRGADWLEKNKRPVQRDELRNLASALNREDAVNAIVREMNNPPRPGAQVASTGWGTGTGGWGGTGGRLGTGPAHAVLNQEEIKQQEKNEQNFEKLHDEFGEKAKDWMGSARVRAWSWYQHDLDRARVTAKQQAKRALNVDFSAVRGRGPEFVLEFTAIVVIIFAAVILGTLDILHSEQIGTLLAAIAGYVLGKSVARSRSGDGEQQAAAPASQPEGSAGNAEPGKGANAGASGGTAG